MMVDEDEKLEHMCPKCREEATSEKHCIRCGKVIVSDDSFVNPNFDRDRFNKMSGGD